MNWTLIIITIELGLIVYFLLFIGKIAVCIGEALLEINNTLKRDKII